MTTLFAFLRWRWFLIQVRRGKTIIVPERGPAATVARIAERVRTGNWESPLPCEQEAEWERAYEEAMQWRDWQTCEILLDEREQSEWWKERRDDA